MDNRGKWCDYFSVPATAGQQQPKTRTVEELMGLGHFQALKEARQNQQHAKWVLEKNSRLQEKFQFNRAELEWIAESHRDNEKVQELYKVLATKMRP